MSSFLRNYSCLNYLQRGCVNSPSKLPGRDFITGHVIIATLPARCTQREGPWGGGGLHPPCAMLSVWSGHPPVFKAQRLTWTRGRCTPWSTIHDGLCACISSTLKNRMEKGQNTYRHTTDIATLWSNRPSRPIRWKACYPPRKWWENAKTLRTFENKYPHNGKNSS